MATGLLVAKTLIKYNRIALRKMIKKRRSQLILSLLSKTMILKLMKMWLTLDGRMCKKKTRKILLWLTSLRACKSKLMRKISKKYLDDYLIISVSYLMKRKIKKIFYEVISNTKIFNIKFCSMKLPTTKILPNLQGTRQGGDWTTPNMVVSIHEIDARFWYHNYKTLNS